MNRRSFFASLFSVAVLPKLPARCGNEMIGGGQSISQESLFPLVPIERKYVPIQINYQSGQDFEFIDAELQLDMDQFAARYFTPVFEAERAAADRFDRDCAFLCNPHWREDSRLQQVVGHIDRSLFA